MANVYGTFTLFKRETKRFLKVYMQTLLAPVVSNLLYFAVFGLSLRQAIPEVQGVSYLAFLVPGLIMLGMINNSFQNPSSSIIIMKFQGLINDLMIIPLKRSEIFLAFISSAILRAFIIGIMTWLTALFFVSFTYPSIPIILITGLLVSLFFAFLGFFCGMWANEFEKLGFLQNFVIMPLIFLGGVFYPIKNLPPLFATLSTYNPIVHMINLTRYGFTGIAEIPLLTSFLVLTTSTLIMGAITYLLFRRGWNLQN